MNNSRIIGKFLGIYKNGKLSRTLSEILDSYDDREQDDLSSDDECNIVKEIKI